MPDISHSEASPALKLHGAKCPACGTYPRIRVSAEESELHQDAPADQRSIQYECHKRLRGGGTCDTRYWITVESFKRAS